MINRVTLARGFARGGLLRDILWAILLGLFASVGNSRPFIPPDDYTVLAEVPPGTRHAELAARQVAAKRLDVALPLAQLYIKQARSTGDLRYLGYAEAVLAPWIGPPTPGSAPGLIAGATTGPAWWPARGSMLGSAPGAVPAYALASAPGAAPVSSFRSAPSTALGPVAASVPALTPEAASGSTPGAAVGVAASTVRPAPGAARAPVPDAPRTSADALVLHATVLQSRHEFARALSVLEQARALRPDDPQAWLTSATVLRVLGRYEQSMAACEQVAVRADPVVAELCKQGVRGLTGDLPSAYAAISQISSHGMAAEERAWRDSELGEMAARLGKDDEAEGWFRDGLRSSPDDFYIRASYADLLLRDGRAQEALTLLKGQDALEPLLLRIAIAQKVLRHPGLQQSSARLAAAFAAEAQRGEGIHRREEARFLLDVQNDPRAALAAAEENWKVQHECDDVLVLMRAARAAGVPQAAAPAAAFVREHGMQDVRIAAVMGVQS
jgi:tetratricopeptide (TPR) repeat protein